MIALRLAMIGHRRPFEPCDFAQDQRATMSCQHFKSGGPKGAGPARLELEAYAWHFFARSIEPVIQTKLKGVDVVEAVVEDKRPARHDVRRTGRGSRKAAGPEIMIAKADEHVLAFHAPVLGERPFESSADCPRGGGFAARGRNEPVAAYSHLALIEDRSLGPNESGAAFDAGLR